MPRANRSWVADPTENWTDVTDPKVRRRLQNRINARAHRRRKAIQREEERLELRQQQQQQHQHHQQQQQHHQHLHAHNAHLGVHHAHVSSGAQLLPPDFYPRRTESVSPSPSITSMSPSPSPLLGIARIATAADDQAASWCSASSVASAPLHPQQQQQQQQQPAIPVYASETQQMGPYVDAQASSVEHLRHASMSQASVNMRHASIDMRHASVDMTQAAAASLEMPPTSLDAPPLDMGGLAAYASPPPTINLPADEAACSPRQLPTRAPTPAAVGAAAATAALFSWDVSAAATAAAAASAPWMGQELDVAYAVAAAASGFPSQQTAHHGHQQQQHHHHHSMAGLMGSQMAYPPLHGHRGMYADVSALGARGGGSPPPSVMVMPRFSMAPHPAAAAATVFPSQAIGMAMAAPDMGGSWVR